MSAVERQYVWPVPASYTQCPPSSGQPGSFGEDRGDRRHCGVDIYAPEGSSVTAFAPGAVIAVEIFTSPERLAYWNRTFLVSVRMFDGHTARYAEMATTQVRVGQLVRAGDVIGTVGTVLRRKDIDSTAPEYIRQLKQNRHLSMLHFELWRDLSHIPVGYTGGNMPGNAPCKQLLDPTSLLRSAAVER